MYTSSYLKKDTKVNFCLQCKLNISSLFLMKTNYKLDHKPNYKSNYKPNYKSNYVIATFCGKQCVSNRMPNDRFTVQPKDFLKIHLQQLAAIPHNLTQITIMKATPGPDDDIWEDYYDVHDTLNELSKKVTVKMYDVPNEGISYGQYINSFKLREKNFDYWFFMEDDYAPVLPNFDTKLINVHKKQGSGIMCAWVAPGLCKISHALCLADNTTLIKVFGENNNQCDYQINRLKNAKKGSCQVIFSLMFTEKQIEITDYSTLYHTPFWNRHFCVDCSIKPTNGDAVFIPLQMITTKTGGTGGTDGINSPSDCRGTKECDLNKNGIGAIVVTSTQLKQLQKHHAAIRVAKQKLIYKGSSGVKK